MSEAWLDIIGVSESGLGGLDAASRRRCLEADVLIASERVLETRGDELKGFRGAALSWPRPFLDIVPFLEERRGARVVLCATGDPLWYGAASALVGYFSAGEMRITPSASGFQLAAARLGWPMQGVRCVSVHGRRHETVLKYLAPKARLLILAHDRHSPRKLAQLFEAAGYGGAVLTVLGHIGGADESRLEATAQEWAEDKHEGQYGDAVPASEIPDFHVLAVACPQGDSGGDLGFLPLVAGLDDGAFLSDGTMTKAEVRAVTLAALKPFDGGVLWDLGCGVGAVGIEWMRAGRHSVAYGIDNRRDRLELAAENSHRLGVPEWRGFYGDLRQDGPGGIFEVMRDVPSPDAVFIGGGLSVALVEGVLERLVPGGRVVVNVVTLESEAQVLRLWQAYGGELKRLSVSRAESVGGYHAWRGLMPVTQWVLRK